MTMALPATCTSGRTRRNREPFLGLKNKFGRLPGERAREVDFMNAVGRVLHQGAEACLAQAQRRLRQYMLIEPT